MTINTEFCSDSYLRRHFNILLDLSLGLQIRDVWQKQSNTKEKDGKRQNSEYKGVAKRRKRKTQRKRKGIFIVGGISGGEGLKELRNSITT